MRYRLSLGIVAATLVFTAHAQRPTARDGAPPAPRAAQDRHGASSSPIVAQARGEQGAASANADPWRKVYADAGDACYVDVRSIVVNGDVIRYATRLSLSDGSAVADEWIGDCDEKRPQPAARYRDVTQKCGRLALADICAQREGERERRAQPQPRPEPVAAASRADLVRERSALVRDLERNRAEQNDLRAKDAAAERLQAELRTEPASDVFMALRRLFRRQAVVDERRSIGRALAEKEAQEATIMRRVGEIDGALR